MEQPAGVGGDRLEVPPLGLGVEGAERQRRLARAGHAGEHDQGVARDVDVDALEVVLAAPADANEPDKAIVSRLQRPWLTHHFHSGAILQPRPWEEGSRVNLMQMVCR